jgi:pimeloyl-ACP methyl ester carboxylesterase
MTAALPQPPVLMIDNANHLAHVDDPEAFVAAANRALYAA